MGIPTVPDKEMLVHTEMLLPALTNPQQAVVYTLINKDLSILCPTAVFVRQLTL